MTDDWHFRALISIVVFTMTVVVVMVAFGVMHFMNEVQERNQRAACERANVIREAIHTQAGVTRGLAFAARSATEATDPRLGSDLVAITRELAQVDAAVAPVDCDQAVKTTFP